MAGRKGIELLKQYFAALKHPFQTRCRFIGISSRRYRALPEETLTIAGYTVPLSPLVENTYDLMHTLEMGRHILHTDLTTYFAPMENATRLSINEVKATYSDLRSLVITFYLETLQLLVIKLDPDEEQCKPLFFTVGQHITTVDNAYLQAVEALKPKATVTASFKDTLLPLVDAFIDAICRTACTEFSDCLRLDTLTVNSPETRPYSDESILTLVEHATRKHYPAIDELLNYYDIAYDLRFESRIFRNLLAHYEATGNDAYHGADLAFYRFYTGRSSLTSSTKLQEQFAALVHKQLQERYEELSRRRLLRFSLKGKQAADLFGDITSRAEACRYLTKNQRAAVLTTANELFKKLQAH